MDFNRYYDGVWLVAFISHGVSDENGNPRFPLSMSALELHTGQVIQYSGSELQGMESAPFPVSRNALFVAYHADAALGCFIALGWSMPLNVLDVFTEFRWLTNGRNVPCGSGFTAKPEHRMPQRAAQAISPRHGCTRRCYACARGWLHDEEWEGDGRYADDQRRPHTGRLQPADAIDAHQQGGKGNSRRSIPKRIGCELFVTILFQRRAGVESAATVTEHILVLRWASEVTSCSIPFGALPTHL